MLKRIVPVIAVAVLLIALAVVTALALLQIGQQAPDSQLTDLFNNVHSYRGKVVVFDFFKPSCGYCQEDAKNNFAPLTTAAKRTTQTFNS